MQQIIGILKTKLVSCFASQGKDIFFSMDRQVALEITAKTLMNIGDDLHNRYESKSKHSADKLESNFIKLLIVTTSAIVIYNIVKKN